MPTGMRRRRSMLRMQHGAGTDHGRDRVFKNQLFLAVVLQKYGVLIKGTDLARQLYSADKVDRNGSFILTDRVKKRVLDVLCRLVVHVPISCSFFSAWDSTTATLKLMPMPEGDATVIKTVR